jgi:hypothetical protein
MFDHISLRTHQFDVMTAFYEQALARSESRCSWPLKERRVWARCAAPSEPSSSIHLALSTPDKSAIRAFHPAALRAGGKTMTPRARDFAPNYYAAFVIDPDGNNIETVSRSA